MADPLPPSGSFFHSIAGRERYCFFHAPRTQPMRGYVLAVHPFAEELNKTRATMADGARALAHAGYAVLQVDLLGCGDSAGDFGEATWDRWLVDVAEGWKWLAARCSGERWLWGVRMGALLAEQFVADEFAVHGRSGIDGLLLWQPVTNGAQHLGQFLRLKTVGNLLRQSAAASAPGAASSSAVMLSESPRAELAAGRAVEIAGYWLNPALAESLESARMGASTRVPPRIRWFEVSAPRGPDGVLPDFSPIASRIAEAWRVAGSDVRCETIAGHQFWQTQEITRCDALVDASVAALLDLQKTS